MKFSLDRSNDNLVIGGYGTGEVVVGRRRYTASLLVTPDGVCPEWGPATVTDLNSGHLADVLAHQPELLILGTGEQQQFPEPALFAALMAAGVGYEVMNTAAACRTYNILLGEGRRVVAALLL